MLGSILAIKRLREISLWSMWPSFSLCCLITGVRFSQIDDLPSDNSDVEFCLLWFGSRMRSHYLLLMGLIKLWLYRHHLPPLWLVERKGPCFAFRCYCCLRGFRQIEITQSQIGGLRVCQGWKRKFRDIFAFFTGRSLSILGWWILFDRRHQSKTPLLWFTLKHHHL